MTDDEPPTKRRKITEEEEDKKEEEEEEGGSHISRLLERCVSSKDKKREDTIAILPYPMNPIGYPSQLKPDAYQLACSDGKIVQALIDSGVSPTAQAKERHP
eukprot:CAMPEP_0201480938 /NCGR_PEP_ID=MMETSP0151_2-20130828/5303_1 /ASSEMBLY_ACC=CAM_ASM_000257 /TAXON_ID=200890 /ORGANISM="Paramoeba atlantica, Strain 621/1 / CCAP 1560/9" /LENGTH=101 /DNA_ID=CAMNT_0047862937 /DNA_START=296 /DNA_END=598 /DNA_ORIENTATION=-